MKLIVENVGCRRGGRVIFEQVGFCLPASSALILRGVNGSGKTSLLKILAGLIPTERGKVMFLQDDNEPDRIRPICYVGHQQGLKVHETVLQNLKFYASLNEISAAMLPAAIRYFDLDRYQDTPLHQLSAGWQRRTSLARLLMSVEPVWLLDEPTNFLDEEAVLLFTNLVETRVKQGGIVVIASHTIQSHFATHVLHISDFQPPLIDIGGEDA
jgi:heme exporter protein A